MKVSQYNSIYDFPSNPSQKLMFNAKSLALALVDCSKVEQYENYCQTHEEIPDEAFLNDLKTGGFLWETVHMSLKALHLSMSLQDDIAYPLKETDTGVFRPV